MLVAARTPEIGIRLALGAGRASIFRLIVGHGVAIAGTGIAIGIAGAAAASRVLGTLLYGVTPLDVPTFLAAPAALAALALLACAIPARRASRVDPALTMEIGGPGLLSRSGHGARGPHRKRADPWLRDAQSVENRPVPLFTSQRREGLHARRAAGGDPARGRGRDDEDQRHRADRQRITRRDPEDERAHERGQ